MNLNYPHFGTHQHIEHTLPVILMVETCVADFQQGQWVCFPSCTLPAKCTNPWETYLPVGTFRNVSSFVTDPRLRQNLNLRRTFVEQRKRNRKSNKCYCPNERLLCEIFGSLIVTQWRYGANVGTFSQRVE